MTTLLSSKPPSETDLWAAYAPSEEAPWNLRRVVHLHRRAGFAATWSEIQRDLKDGPQASIDRLPSRSPAPRGNASVRRSASRLASMPKRWDAERPGRAFPRGAGEREVHGASKFFRRNEVGRQLLEGDNTF